jgi:hypothetical protein
MTLDDRLEALNERLRKWEHNSPWEKEFLANLGYDRWRWNASHIWGNGLCALGVHVRFATGDIPPYLKSREEHISAGEQEVKLLETYIDLLTNFPDYQKAEFGKDEGFFPDISKVNRSPQDNFRYTYIMESKKRLRNV